MSATAVVTAAARLAVDDNDVSPGVLGFLVVALLGVATYFLIRSMNRQIGRIDLPDETAESDEKDDVGPPAAGPGADRPDRPGPDEGGLSPR